MSRLVAFNKPYAVLSQYTDEGSNRQTLKRFFVNERLYPAGRLDYDSEGLLLLTDNGTLQHAISHPKFKQTKTYWVQVDGQITEQALAQLRRGVLLKDGMTAPAQAQAMEEPQALWPRDPPIRYRANIPTSWLCLSITEGKNRQVRRMTAAVGFPTLRLIRAAIGDWQLLDLAAQPGTFSELPPDSYGNLLKRYRANAPAHPGRSASVPPSGSRRRR